MREKNQTDNPTAKQTIDPASLFQPLEDIEKLPIITLPKVVLFPGNSLPLTTLEGLSPKDYEAAEKGNLRLGIVTKMSDGDEEQSSQISAFGTEALVHAIIRLGNGKIGAIVRGTRRFFIRNLYKKDSHYWAQVTIASDLDDKASSKIKPATMTTLKNLIQQVLRLNPSINHEAITVLYAADDARLLCDIVVQNLSLSTEEKLVILSTFRFSERLDLVLKALSREVELLKLSNKIQEDIKGEIQEGVKKNFLREQMAAIRRELGEEDNTENELLDLKQELDKKSLPEHVLKTVDSEWKRLRMMHPSSPEYHVCLNYLSWIKDLPWDFSSLKDKDTSDFKTIDMGKAALLLDKEHYGIKDVKERILEHLAVMKHRGFKKGDIILLDGPPGVGKTSLAQSIAKALGRPFKRISLGGVKDEAEIRGHRRTYVGALPGKIIQAIKECKTNRCVLLLDEMDKAGRQGQSDICSALLEVLDPEQNTKFTDHFLGFPYDLSQVLFIGTSNQYKEVPPALLDRMELIRVFSYTEKEKVQIAKKHMIPKIRKNLQLSAKQFSLSEHMIRLIASHYTREAGVRSLDRQLQKIGRKLVKEVVMHPRQKAKEINESSLIHYLGVPKFIDEPQERRLQPGVATGLAYTAFGGDVLYIESQISKGEGGQRLLITGSLGNVMQESVQTVLSFIKSQSSQIGIPAEAFSGACIHLHVPDGATPKDGPSAGIAIMTSIVSLLKQKPISASIAMTGEVTLRGQVLPVGGIKEKVLAAYRYKKKTVLIPASNILDLSEIDKDVLNAINIYPVRHMLDVLRFVGLCSQSISSKPLEPIKVDQIDSSKFKSAIHAVHTAF